jgi:hypothetical protein
MRGVNRYRIFAVAFVAAVLVAIVFYTQSGKKKGGGGGGSGWSSGMYAGGHPASSKCVGSCDLTTQGGAVKAYVDATGKPIPDGKDCEYVNRAFPRVVPFGQMGTDNACHRLGTLYGCCFTEDPRAATPDALSLLGWADATFAKRTELAENWIRFGIYGLTDTFVLLDKQDFFEAKLILHRELEQPEVLPMPDGGLQLRMWVVVHHTPEGPDALVTDEYSRWEYVFSPNGTLAGEKVIDHVIGKPH